MSRAGDTLPRATRPRPPGLVVELCGLPGAGKTTLARTVVEALRDRAATAAVLDAGVSAATAGQRRAARKVVLATRAVVGVDTARGARGLAQLRAGWVLAAGQDRRRDRVAVPLQWWATQALVGSARHRPGVWVAEEGLVQTWWTARMASTAGVDAVCALPVPVRPDVVVHLQVPPGLARQRLAARASRHSRLQRLPVSDQVSALERGERLLATLLEAWCRRGLGPVLTLDATDVTPAALDALVSDLLGHAGRAPGRGTAPGRAGT